MATVDVAVPRKGRPLEAVLARVAAATGRTDLADGITSTLRYEKAVAKGDAEADGDVYERLAAYSDLSDETVPDYTLLRDDRPGMPRRIVFDSVTVPLGETSIRLVGREEPFRALRTHAFPLGFDSADLVLEEVVSLRPEPLRSIADLNDRIDPHDTDVRVVTGLGDTVRHTLLGTEETLENGPGEALDRRFVTAYEGPLCISPRYERLVEAVLGTRAVEGIEFVYPTDEQEEEAAIADVGIGVYLTVTGGTAREHDLLLGERLFPSETVLLANEAEAGPVTEEAIDALAADGRETGIVVG